MKPKTGELKFLEKYQKKSLLLSKTPTDPEKKSQHNLETGKDLK